MKVLLIACFVLAPLAHASIEFEIQGPCSATPAAQGRFEAAKLPITAGQATIEILEREKIPYIGSEGGMNSILGTPTGDGALEIISDQEMRAYGWCYEVDGMQPDVMPDQVLLHGKEKLRWFYAFSLYRKGKWVNYCEPAYTVRPPKLCPN